MADFKYFKGLGAFTQLQATFANANVALQSAAISVAEFTFSEARESENLLGYANGEHQTKVVLPGSPEYTLTITSNVQTQQLLALGRSEAWRPIPGSLDVLRPFAIEVPSNGICAVPGIVQANSATTSISSEADNGVPLSIITTGTPTAAQALLEDDQITVDTSRAGETLFTAFLDQPASGSMIGGPVASNARHTLTEFSFIGDYYDTEAGDGVIWIPRCQITSPPDVSLTGDAAVFSVEAEVLSQTGWDVPYMLMKDVAWA